MTISFWCVLASIAVTYLAKVPIAIAMQRHGGYDNRNPRDQQKNLTGWGKRALAAHQNCFEVFPVFAACVFISQFRNADSAKVGYLAITFVALRFLYVV